MREAMQSGDIRDYVADLRRRFPSTQAEDMLEKLRAKDPAPMPAFSAAPVTELAEHELPVFNFHEEPPKTVPRSEPPIRLAPSRPPSAEPRTIPFAADVRPPKPIVSRPPTRSPYEVAEDDSPQSTRDVDFGGRWLATLLFLLVLVFSIGLGLYVIARPFLPGMGVQ